MSTRSKRLKILVSVFVCVIVAVLLTCSSAAVVPPWLQNTEDGSSSASTESSNADGSCTRSPADIPLGTAAPYYMYFGSAYMDEYAYWSELSYQLGIVAGGDYPYVVGGGFGIMGATQSSEIIAFSEKYFCGTGSLKYFKRYGYLLTCWDDSTTALWKTSSDWRSNQSRLLLSVYEVGLNEDGFAYMCFIVSDSSGNAVTIDSTIFNAIKSASGYRGLKWFGAAASTNPICSLSYYNDEDISYLIIEQNEEPQPYALGHYAFLFTPCDCGTPSTYGTQIRKLCTRWSFKYYMGAGTSSIWGDFSTISLGVNFDVWVCSYAFQYLGIIAVVFVVCLTIDSLIELFSHKKGTKL